MISGAPFKVLPQDIYPKDMLLRTLENAIAVCLKLKFVYYIAMPEHKVYHFIKKTSLVSKKWLLTFI